jgi:hypothetical protein
MVYLGTKVNQRRLLIVTSLTAEKLRQKLQFNMMGKAIIGKLPN